MSAIKSFGCALLAAALLPAAGMAADNVFLASPAKNAALIPQVPAFKHAVVEEYVGKRFISEGVVIRKSFIRDGKIVIPPAGLLYSSRGSNAGPMTANEYWVLGRRVTDVSEESQLVVIKNRTMKPGEMVNLLPDGSRALHFRSVSVNMTGGQENAKATFGILKANGNYYGTNFVVNGGGPLLDVCGGYKGLGLEEGIYSLDKDAPEPLQHNTFFGNSIAVAGNSCLIAGKITGGEVEVKEFVTPALKKIWLTFEPRINGAYAAGESVAVGDAMVKVLSVTADSAEVSLTTRDGKTVTRVFSGLGSRESALRLPGSAADRDKYQMFSGDGSVCVQAAMLHPQGVLTADGKVRLDLFSGVFSLDNPQPWPADPRFNVRLDTCASCRLLGEFLLENAREIVLDAKNNVVEGPEKYFRVVIDEFDGKKVLAWHFEDADGNKSPSLASFANGAHIDLAANFENSSVGKFGNRTAELSFAKELAGKGMVMKK